jgi:hypothetical protein
MRMSHPEAELILRLFNDALSASYYQVIMAA